MNEQIKELAKLAGFKDLPTVRLAFYSFNKEKFAELIIKKCAQVASDSNQSKNRDVGVTVGDVILTHFGVEE